jgi:hypothetical protein
MRCVLVYALPNRQWLWELDLPEAATVSDALQAGQRQAQLANLVIDWDAAAVGIFGRCCSRTQRLQAGDRIEVYRPLACDPKESRRERARRLRGARRR